MVGSSANRNTTREHIFCRSATDQFFQVFGVPRPLHRDLGGSTLDLPEVVSSELDCRYAKVLLLALQLTGAGDGHNPRLLGQQPRQRELRRGSLLRCKRGQHIHQPLIRFTCLGRKARGDIAKVSLVERRVLVDLSRQEAFAKGDYVLLDTCLPKRPSFG
jgi:hypothetical protein